MDIALHIVDGRIRDATYATFQCPGAHASGKALCDRIQGKTIAEASEFACPVLMRRECGDTNATD